MNPVEAGILERVARLHPAVFQALAAFVERHGAFLDPGIAAVSADLPFYLGWLDLVRPLQDAGLPFCYPDVSATDAGLEVHGLFDLALALRRDPPGDGIVTNDLELSSAERLVVITGPNQGGKTSFARADRPAPPPGGHRRPGPGIGGARGPRRRRPHAVRASGGPDRPDRPARGGAHAGPGDPGRAPAGRAS